MTADPRTEPAQNGRERIEGSFDGLTASIPRVALTRAEAAAALGMSSTPSSGKCGPELPIIRSACEAIATEELQQWARAAGQRTLG